MMMGALTQGMTMLVVAYRVLRVMAQVLHLGRDGTMDVEPVILELFLRRALFALQETHSANHV